MGLARGRFAGAVLALIGVGLLVRADEEAICSNGRRVRGTLTVTEGGTLHFVPAGQDKPLPADALEGIRIDPAAAVVSRAGNSLRANLADGQHLTGELLKLDGERAQLRPAWVERIDLSRNAVVSLTHPPGYRTLFAGDPVGGAKAWKATGETLSYEPPAPPEAGRAGVTFEKKDKTGGATWQFEAVFQTESAARSLKVTVAGPGESYQVETVGLNGETRDVRRTAGPHRLVVQFTKQSLRVTCDDDVLWYNVEQGPGGALKEVRLSRVESGKVPAANGGVVWSAFYLAKAVDETRHPAGDVGQDEAWLASDDQLFGTIASADARGVELEGRFGKRSLAWADLRGVYFRRPQPTEPKSAPNAVRVRLRTGFGAETDVLDGVLLKLDERQFVLKHALLGELRLDRKWLSEVRPVADRK
jgi:hypothetical protein